MRKTRQALIALGAATALLAAGCSSDDRPDERAPDRTPAGSDGGSEEPGGEDAAADAPPLEPLPEAIPDDLRPYYDQELSWSPCGGSDFECAMLTVPLDYEAIDPAQDIELRVTRLRTSEPDGRIGTLLMNPGGPGASAVEFVQSWGDAAFPADTLDRYDLGAIDPRGTGGSEPVECLTGEAMDAYTLVDRTPDSDEEADQLVAAMEEFTAACAERSGDLLEHISTIETARDMDVLRGALGDEQLHYLGFSYGTKLGAVYAGLFPQRAGHLVLDAAVDPRLSTLDTDREQAGGFETAFRSFAEDCLTYDDCPLGDENADAASEALLDFFAAVDAEPLPSGDPERPLTESLATTGVASALYAVFMWGDLRSALSSAMEDGDGSGLLALADSYNERGPDGSYATSSYAFPAISCLDSPAGNATEDDVRAVLTSYEEASPTFGRDFAWATLVCAAWPVEPSGHPVSIAAAGAADILVVGTLRDPATPYGWAEGLAEQLDSATLLTYDGDGHGAYGGNSSCVDAAVNTYLVEGTVPEENTTCS
ncbi:alpha/beta hydrolase [Streptomyces avicenniae]|uniref:alpha/beta hydrolase n=1 Tax=Streptomyces avicenniae TaxID=500153 RepID=UPI00069C038F|nr:alpha/beta hydrolase [Streptomyces avicenniae]